MPVKYSDTHHFCLYLHPSMKKLIRITTIPLSLDKLLGKQLSFMNDYYEVIAVSADEKELERVTKKYGVKHHHVEMTRQITPWKDLKAVWKMYKFLKKEKPEIVHTHTPKAGLVGMMAAYFAGVPNRLHTVAGLPLLEASGPKRKVLNLVEKITYAFANKIYPNSFGLQKIIVDEKFCSPQKLKVIGNGSSNGIDSTRFNLSQVPVEKTTVYRQQLSISEKDFVFIFVGRLVKDKGINELVAAFCNLKSSLKTSNPQTLKLLLVGPHEKHLDPLNPETEQEISKNPDIIETGFQSDVRPFFAVSDALVFPSYREGFPNVVLQALSMELPAIVSNINGCNEIITSNKNGIIVPAKDEKALQKAMEKLYNDHQFYVGLKKTSRESIMKYEQKHVWQELLKEYRSL